MTDEKKFRESMDDLLDYLQGKEVLCVECDCPVEPSRRVYVHPTCYACLPPPDPFRPVRDGGPEWMKAIKLCAR